MNKYPAYMMIGLARILERRGVSSMRRGHVQAGYALFLAFGSLKALILNTFFL